jgi:PDDEXK-like domain of unknown function (DUF3799)
MSVIEKLRDDHEYYSGIGKNYLSNSDISALLTNPKAFRQERLDNKSFAEGRLFHQLILEPEKVDKVVSVDVSSRNTKEYKAFCSERNMDFALLTKEVEEIHTLVGVIKANIAFYDDIYREGNVYEEPKIGVIKGIDFKGKADIITHDYIIDLKTTSDINKFKWSAKAYNYDSQCYIYEQLFGKPLYFYVIDKETAQLGVFRPTEQFVKNGELKVERAIQVYQKYFGPNATEDIDNHFINETLD